MLAALFLLGVLPFVAMPVFQMNDSATNDLAEEKEDAEESADFFDDASPEPDDRVSPGGDFSGTTYSVAATQGTTEIQDFTPGEDSLEMDLTDVPGEVLFEMTSNQEGSVLSVAIGEGAVSTLLFEGLNEVPAGDIFLTLSDGATGETYQISLSDALTEETLDPVDPDAPDEPGPEVGEDTVIGPSDPENPDAPGPEVSDEDSVLDPVDPDAEPNTTSGENPLTSGLLRDSDNVGGANQTVLVVSKNGTVETILGDEADSVRLNDDGIDEAAQLTLAEGTAQIASDSPIDIVDGGAGDDTIATGDEVAYAFGGEGDDVIHAGNGVAPLYGGAGADLLAFDGETGTSAYLDGGEGKDTLVLSNRDTASGGSGDDLIWVYTDGLDGSEVADVLDFKVGEDFLRVSLNPQIGENGEPDVQVVPSQDGEDGLVIVNGDLVAVLRGASGATASDVYAEVKMDIF